MQIFGNSANNFDPVQAYGGGAGKKSRSSVNAGGMAAN